LVKNGKAVRRWEVSFLRGDRPDYARNVRIVEALFREAVALGVYPPRDRFSGLETDLKIARAINRVLKTP